MTAYDYIHDGNAIYEKSFAIIRSEADLSRFSEEEADVAVRMIHACGMVEAAQHFVFSRDFVPAARTALLAGAPVLCDAEMVSRGVTVARLPAKNEVVCTLRDTQTAELAMKIGNTRSAAALERLETHRPPSSICLKCLRKARRSRLPSSACRWVLWAPPNRKRRWLKASSAFPMRSYGDAWAAAP